MTEGPNTITDLYRQRERLHARYRELWDDGDFYRARIVFRAKMEVSDLINEGKLPPIPQERKASHDGPWPME
jgi:hypothetical protein